MHTAGGLAPSLQLPLTLLTRYLFFLARRPISSSNPHFMTRRLAGLRSLAPLLEGHAAVGLTAVVDKLRRLSPANFPRLGPALQKSLVPLLPTELPAGYIGSRRPPASGYVAGSHRILMILGPGIGIGDEIICFSIAQWLRQARSDVVIELLSAYPGLWDGVAGVDRVSYYRRYAEMVEAIRRPAGDSGFDLVMLVDFEKPALLNAMSGEPTVERYVELSLGARSVWALDNTDGWLRQHRPPELRFTNYYSVLPRLAGWLTGASEPLTALGGRDRLRHRASGTHGLSVFVSPFTSKYEPQESKWSQLLAGAVPDHPDTSIRFVFDPGPNQATERFALSLMRSTRGRTSPATRFEIAHSPDSRTLSLSGLFRLLEGIDVVVCADSFAAHAAPVSGCTTLVVAGKGLRDWRVPRAQSYYFDDSAPIPHLAAAMRHVLDLLAKGRESTGVIGAGAAARRLLGASGKLATSFASSGDGDASSEFLDLYDEFFRSYRALVAILPKGSPALEALLEDQDYDLLLPSLPPASLLEDMGRREDLREHLQDRFETWETSNLCKYLLLANAGDSCVQGRGW